MSSSSESEPDDRRRRPPSPAHSPAVDARAAPPRSRSRSREPPRRTPPRRRRDRRAPRPTLRPRPTATLFITNLPPDAAAREDDLAAAAGPGLTRLTVGRSRTSALARGWAVAEFKDAAAAAAAADKLDGASVLGETLIKAAPAFGVRSGGWGDRRRR